MLPNAREVGWADKSPGVTPVPDNAMVRGELAASEARLRLPLAEPAALGMNFTVNAMLCPAAMLAGKVSPLIEKAALLTSAFETVTVLPPVLVTVSERLAWLPTWALPNASVVGLDAMEPLFPGLGFPASPWQPAKSRGSRTTGMTLAQSH